MRYARLKKSGSFACRARLLLAQKQDLRREPVERDAQGGDDGKQRDVVENRAVQLEHALIQPEHQLLRAVESKADRTEEAEEALQQRELPPDDAPGEPRHEERDAEREKQGREGCVGPGEQDLDLAHVCDVSQNDAERERARHRQRKPAGQRVVLLQHLLPTEHAEKEDGNTVCEAV